MEDFVNTFKSVRNMPNLVPSRETGLPPELHQKAKHLVSNKTHQYSILKIYEIIISNLKSGKSILEIKQGLSSISKYPLCLFLDQDRPEFHQIRTFSGYYTYEIKEKLESFEPILEALGYQYDPPSQLYKLSNEVRQNPGFDDTIAVIGCELLLACEELDLFLDMLKIRQSDPIIHFTSLHGFSPSQNYTPQADNYQQFDQNTANKPLEPYPPHPQRQDIQQSNPTYDNLGKMKGRPLPQPPGSQPGPGTGPGRVEQAEVDMKPISCKRNLLDQARHDIPSQHIGYNQNARAHEGLPAQNNLNPYPEDTGRVTKGGPGISAIGRNFSGQNVLDNERDGGGMHQAQYNPQGNEPSYGRGSMVNPNHSQIAPGIQGYENRDASQMPTENLGHTQGNQRYTYRDVSQGQMGNQGHSQIAPGIQGYENRDASQMPTENLGYPPGNQGHHYRDVSQGQMGNQGHSQIPPGIQEYENRDASQMPTENLGYPPGNQGHHYRDASQGQMGNQGHSQIPPGTQEYENRDASQMPTENQGHTSGNQRYTYRDVSQGQMANQGHSQISPGIQGYENRDASQMPTENQGHTSGNQRYTYRDVSQGQMANQGHSQISPGIQGYENRDASQMPTENQGHTPGNQGYTYRDVSQGQMGNQGHSQIPPGIQGYENRDASQGRMADQGHSQLPPGNQGFNSRDASGVAMGNQGHSQISPGNQGYENRDARLMPTEIQGYTPGNQGYHYRDVSQGQMANQGHSQISPEYQGYDRRDANQESMVNPNHPQIQPEHQGYMANQGHSKISNNPQSYNQMNASTNPTEFQGQNEPANIHGDPGRHQRPVIPPKPARIPEPGNNFEDFKNMQLTIHSETPRGQIGPSASNPVQELPVHNNQQSEGDMFKSSAFDRHGSVSLHDTEKRVSQEQRYSGIKDPLSEPEAPKIIPRNLSDIQKPISDKQIEPSQQPYGEAGIRQEEYRMPPPQGYEQQHHGYNKQTNEPLRSSLPLTNTQQDIQQGMQNIQLSQTTPAYQHGQFNPQQNYNKDYMYQQHGYPIQHNDAGHNIDAKRYDLYHEPDLPFSQAQSQDFSRPVGNVREPPGPGYQYGEHETYNTHAPRSFGQEQDPYYRQQVESGSYQHEVQPHNDPYPINPVDYHRRDPQYDEFQPQQYPHHDQQYQPQQRYPTNEQQYPTHHPQYPTQQQPLRLNTKPWDCPHCTYNNNPNSKVCEMCSKTPDFLLTTNAAVPEHKRICDMCKEHNKLDAKFCYSCGRNFFPEM